MKRVVLFFLFGCLSVIAFAAFPVETQALIADVDPEVFKLDTWGFIIGILTAPLLYFLVCHVHYCLLIRNISESP